MSNKIKLTILGLLITLNSLKAQQKLYKSYDVCVYGATSAGVMAAYTAAQYGKSVLLIEPGKHVGGMSSGGLGLTDIGNKYAISGLALDFYRQIGQHYGKFEQWIFEPHVAENIFNTYLKKAKVPVLYQNRVTAVKKQGNVITEILLESADQHSVGSVKAKVFIDCSYEGDLMARAGVSYMVGREANTTYGETFNGVQLTNGHQLPDGIDPYKVKGDAKSGLLWGITNGQLAAKGSGDNKVQAYNFRICLSNDPKNRIPITKPAHYQPEHYELLIRQMEKRTWKSLQDVFIWSRMPNQKTDINNRNGFSTDMIGMNWDYPDADYRKRQEIWSAHTDYTKGLLYFVGHDPRIPEYIRAEMNEWGYPKDEYRDNENWTHQLYVREARRMKGALVMTQHHCEGRELVPDGIGMAAYTMDSHNCERLVVNGMVKNEGNVEEGGFGPYPIAYRAITPQEKEAANLLVPVCLSATHIAYGSIRMEPVFMVLGQSAALAAVKAIDGKSAVQQIDVASLQRQLKQDPLADGSAADILIDNSDSSRVKMAGQWSVQKRGGYGPDYFLSDGNMDTSSFIRYYIDQHIKGRYEIYTYYAKLPERNAVTAVKIFDGKGLREVAINDEEVKVVGQTSGEWVKLGDFTFSGNGKPYVEISGKGKKVAADAVLLVSSRK
ncbi:FAD-dependent oxidoreductase [Pedobacter sp. KBS0701]|uniref:FAD-dependent oxidoreductase n=1 Tax=Pedobacter sp. KBS0701 TaxID=2578106 RepID=UPI00110DBC3A|nr:FAD-dependent oxidoreductase [Pedobacter sp. KBS0701]QDW24827.1 FAD-dependent oxidoreductase [Pedobacter sp. KBS0701]